MAKRQGKKMNSKTESYIKDNQMQCLYFTVEKLQDRISSKSASDSQEFWSAQSSS